MKRPVIKGNTIVVPSSHDYLPTVDEFVEGILRGWGTDESVIADIAISVSELVNNAIVLIDYINLLRARGQTLSGAIVNAGRSRLRPVLITTMTTSLAMLPMILSRGEGAATWKPMAATIVGGLTFSMLVTLVLVPTLYSLVHSRRARKREQAAAMKGVLP